MNCAGSVSSGGGSSSSILSSSSFSSSSYFLSSSTLSSSSSVQDAYEFCKENPSHSFCTGQGGGSSSSKSVASSSSQETPAKHNERGPDAVYTADDIFSGGLDNMESGKCYSLNPDRGTQYGWINNDAQDRWWWVEVSCGWNFSPKRYISERDSENPSAEESDSDYALRNKTKLLYDAAGRKTQASPETRRFLFLPKKALDKGQKSK
jgi:hypothetical protein